MIDKSLILDRKIRVASAITILLFGAMGSLYLIWVTQIPKAEPSSALSSIATTTRKPGKASSESTAASAAVADSSSTTTSTTKPQATTQETTTTQPEVFSPSASVSLTDVSIVQCISATYTFSGSITANGPGTVSYDWVRWDDAPTSSSGTITFDSDGIANGSVQSLTFTVPNQSDFTGWVSLALTWEDSVDTSEREYFEFSSAAINNGVVPTGC
jgi:hypothetical protein